MEDGGAAEVAYLGTGRHGGGIILRPLFIKESGSWVNATTGKEAPTELADSFELATAPSPEGKDIRWEIDSRELAEHCRLQGRCTSQVVVRVLAGLSWNERCEGLVKVTEAFSWAGKLGDVYQRLCEVMAELFKCSQVHMHLASTDGRRFVRRAYCSDDTSEFKRDESLSTSVGRMLWMMENHHPIVMDYEHPHLEDEIPEEALRNGVRSAVSIPLLADDLCLGMISLVYRFKTEWTEEDCSYLVLVGRTAGALIKRLFDTKKAAELQVLNERKLLSTEIHENVSSLLGAVSVNAEAAIAALEEDDEGMAREDLERLEITAEETMRILRDEMFSLRINLEDTDALIEGMQECLENFERNWGFETELSITGPCLPVVVPTQASLQLTRILNECLSNTLRHSRAAKVRVEVHSEERAVTMEVCDDGCGFDVDAVDSDHFGIKIMRERALAAGGRLSIRSNGDGTAVLVEIPRRRASASGGGA
ncbi:MAG: GAF domain-containing sensor histidine kinase [Coriobacteriales bacterium]